MRCFMIFDDINDIVFNKYDIEFLILLKSFAASEGLLDTISEDCYVDGNENIVIHMLLPIVTSYKIMLSQFGNSYTSIQWCNGLSLCFEECFGFIFIYIGGENISIAQQTLSICVSFSRYLCGANIHELKLNRKVRETYTDLISYLENLTDKDQSLLVQAIEKVVIGSSLNLSLIQILQDATEKIMNKCNYKKIHTMLLVQNKMVALYSSKRITELSPVDLLFLTTLSHIVEKRNSCSDNKRIPLKMVSYLIFLSGSETRPQSLANTIYFSALDNNIVLLFVIETDDSLLSVTLYEAFCHLFAFKLVAKADNKIIKNDAFENLDLAIGNLEGFLRKQKTRLSYSLRKRLIKKWNIIRKKCFSIMKSNTDVLFLKTETYVMGVLENLKEMFQLITIKQHSLEANQDDILSTSINVSSKLADFKEFLKIKAMSHIGCRGSSLSLKFLEEFPGLLNFILINRNTHRLVKSSIDINVKSYCLNKNMIWKMIDLSWNRLKDGELTQIWKDDHFYYSYYLWFENSNGILLKIQDFTLQNQKLALVPGILNGDFYLKLKEIYYPKVPLNKLKCYEIFSIHLGYVPLSSVLEHGRRLATTLWDLKCDPLYSLDLI